MIEYSELKTGTSDDALLGRLSIAAKAAPLALLLALTACQSTSGSDDDVASATSDVEEDSADSSSDDEADLDSGTTYASASISSLAEALASTGDSLTVPSSVVSNSSGVRSLIDEPVSITITKTDDGYDLTYEGTTVSFTSADLDSGSYDKYTTAGDDSSSEIAGIVSLNGDLNTQLASSSVMVPVRYWAELKEGEISNEDDSDTSVTGYTAIGVVTDPDDMPTTGTASYSGGGQIQIWATDYSSDSTDVKRLRYDGTTSFTADFDSGSLEGELAVTDLRTYYDDGTRTDEDVSSEGYKYIIEEATISGNEIEVTSDTGNSALDAQLDASGLIDSDGLETGGSGLFYGDDADALAIAVSGSGTTATMSGLLYGEKD